MADSTFDRHLKALKEIATYKGEGRINANWQEIVKSLGDIARKAIEPTISEKIRDADSAMHAAQIFHEWIFEQCKEANQNPDIEISFWSPEECPRGWGGWHVCWEGGHFEWATALCGGSAIYAGELGSYSLKGPFPDGICGNWGHAEPGYSFSLVFHSS